MHFKDGKKNKNKNVKKKVGIKVGKKVGKKVSKGGKKVVKQVGKIILLGVTIPKSIDDNTSKYNKITNLDEIEKKSIEENQTKEIFKLIEKNQTKKVPKPTEKRSDVIDDKPDEELVTEDKEEVVEVPSEEPGKKKFIKKIIKCITIINPTTGEKKVVEELVEEVPFEVKEETEVKEEVVEVPSEEPGKKKFIKKIIKCVTRINPTTGEKEVVEEIVDEVPVKPININRMSRKELKIFIREQPLRLIETIQFEADTKIIPLINEYEEKVRTQPRSELKIMFRTIMEFLAQKIKLLDRIESKDKEIICKLKCLFTDLQLLERRTEEI
ncbi:hypothetical protein H8356DRAFT_542740 [Neocallimastix lanati (nom. inval.)]|nr:hypothetical protein H8356DRAFT_542740 [Neocallimastix sp. JGI-2020a]